MPKITFTVDHTMRLSRHAVRRFKAGKTYLESQERAQAAIDAGVATPAKAPRRRRGAASGEPA